MPEKISVEFMKKVWDSIGQVIDGYKERPSQIKLFKAVLDAMIAGEHIVAEGPCGSGKTMTYLMGHLIRNQYKKGRTVIVVPNNTLVGQIRNKDILMAEDIATINGLELEWAMIMGKGNYICRSRFYRYMKSGSFKNGRMKLLGEYVRGLDKMAHHWLGHIDKLEYYSSIKDMLTIPSGRCRGSNCIDAPYCEMVLQRQHGRIADVVITNVHVWIMDCLLKQIGAEGSMLGEYDYLVFDEAHAVPDIVRDYFSLNLSDEWAEKIALKLPVHFRPQFRVGWKGYVRAFQLNGQEGLVSKFPVKENIANAFVTILEECHDAIAGDKDMKDDDFQLLEDLTRMLDICGDALRGTVSPDTHAYGYYEDKDNGEVKNRRIICMELSSGRLLQRLYPDNVQITAMSATLAMHSKKRVSFKFIKDQLGLEDAKAAIVDSPFDFSKSIVLTLSDGPNPNDWDAWVEHCYLAMRQMIINLGGRTLGLFTSTKRMLEVADRLKRDPVVMTPILAQGDASTPSLIRDFREEEETSLLGVDSFWAGLDVKGKSLSGVFIERTPFPPPDDLVSSALEKNDKNSFFTYNVPFAIIKVKQGVGRLVRSVDDMGLVVYGDSRILEKRYGKRILRNILPGSYQKAATIPEMTIFAQRLGEKLEEE